jgi:integrase
MIKKHSDKNQDQPQQPQDEVLVPKGSRKKSASRKKRTRRRSGEGTVTLRKDGRYQANISLGTDEKTGKRKRLTRYGKTEDEAFEELHKALEDQRKGMLVQGNQQTVGQFLNEWLENVHKPTLDLSSYLKYRRDLNNHIIPALGRIKLQSLHQSQVQAFYARKLDEGIAPVSIRVLHAILHTALKHAVKWEYVAKNVCDLVSPPRIVRKRNLRFLTQEEALRLLESLRGHRLETLVALALATGMRKGELLALHWNDVNLDANLERRTLQVQHTVGVLPGYGIYESDPKTDASRRSIILPDYIVKLLKQHRVKQTETRTQAKAWENPDLIFTNRKGGYLNPTYLNTPFNKAVAAAGLPPMRFHDLRHSAATILLAMGIHPKVVQELLGHSKISTTMDLYSHALPTMQHAAMNEMDNFLKGQKQG